MVATLISAAGFEELHKAEGALDLIDVRTPVEFAEIHVEFAKNVPLDGLDPADVMQERDQEKTLYIICRSGARGEKARQAFADAGFTNVVNVEGGTLACEATGLPLVRGQKMMSLERQVRIAAGSLVLLGVILGWQVHPGFFGLSAFVGVGLIFAGITDFCGMGLLLAKMPWNTGSCRL